MRAENEGLESYQPISENLGALAATPNQSIHAFGPDWAARVAISALSIIDQRDARITELEMQLIRLRNALAQTYSLSPEGRAELARIDAALAGQQQQSEPPIDDKSHPRFIAGYTAGLHDRALEQAATHSEDGREMPDWRAHSAQFAKGEKCPETLETLQAAWARDQEMIFDQKAEIGRFKATVNDLRQKLAVQPARPGGRGERNTGAQSAIEMARSYAANTSNLDLNAKAHILGLATVIESIIHAKPSAVFTPAAAAVVMPERLPGIPGRSFVRGYNAGLDEVTRLNRHPVPLELLERALRENCDPAVNAELRVILKEGKS